MVSVHTTSWANITQCSPPTWLGPEVSTDQWEVSVMVSVDTIVWGQITQCNPRTQVGPKQVYTDGKCLC